MLFSNAELLSGKRDECRKVAFNTLMTSPPASHLGACHMFAMFAWQDDPQAVTRVLTALGDGAKFSVHLKDTTAAVSGASVVRARFFMVKKCEDLGCLYEGVSSWLYY